MNKTLSKSCLQNTHTHIYILEDIGNCHQLCDEPLKVFRLIKHKYMSKKTLLL